MIYLIVMCFGELDEYSLGDDPYYLQPWHKIYEYITQKHIRILARCDVIYVRGGGGVAISIFDRFELIAD